MSTRETLVFIGCLVVAIILHEISHGVVALWFGDDTAKRAGRLTLNPIPHIDPFGSIVLPRSCFAGGDSRFGFAKPVPVNPSRLRNPRRDMVYVSLAGPATNFVLMAVAAFAARAAYVNSCAFLFRSSTRGSRAVRVRAGQSPVGALQPPPDPTARRQRVDRAGAPGGVAAGLVPVPALRDPRAVPARVLDRVSPSSSAPFYDRLFDFVFR